MPLLNYRSLFVLYGVSALVFLVFGLGYAYARLHRWYGTRALVVFLPLGAIAALFVWAWLEPRLLDPQPIEYKGASVIFNPQLMVEDDPYPIRFDGAVLVAVKRAHGNFDFFAMPLAGDGS